MRYAAGPFPGPVYYARRPIIPGALYPVRIFQRFRYSPCAPCFPSGVPCFRYSVTIPRRFPACFRRRPAFSPVLFFTRPGPIRGYIRRVSVFVFSCYRWNHTPHHYRTSEAPRVTPSYSRKNKKTLCALKNGGLGLYLLHISVGFICSYETICK